MITRSTFENFVFKWRNNGSQYIEKINDTCTDNGDGKQLMCSMNLELGLRGYPAVSFIEWVQWYIRL